VARDANSNPIATSTIGIQISLRQGSPLGTVVYQENHFVNTDQFGLFNLTVGGGSVQSGNISTIDWAAANYYLQVGMDANGGTNFLNMGTTQLLSVPYALYAKSSTPTYLIAGSNITLTGLGTQDDPYVVNASGSAGGTGVVSNPGAGVSFGGVNYPTVVLGNGQEWMAENLRTTQYNDGTPITLVTDDAQWLANSINNTTVPMMSWRNNDQATYTANTFGALYNWYAVSPTTNGNRNVCPVGWHVPTDAEWAVLTSYLGGSYAAGGKMKSTGTQYWVSPNIDATNESGFSGLPGGKRDYDGAFGTIGYGGNWWSSTEYYSNIAVYRELDYGIGPVGRDDNFKTVGCSVRCLRD
jgi:uncharacterized protein (TIGR02145 family)